MPALGYPESALCLLSCVSGIGTCRRSVQGCYTNVLNLIFQRIDQRVERWQRLYTLFIGTAIMFVKCVKVGILFNLYVDG